MKDCTHFVMLVAFWFCTVWGVYGITALKACLRKCNAPSWFSFVFQLIMSVGLVVYIGPRSRLDPIVGVFVLALIPAYVIVETLSSDSLVLSVKILLCFVLNVTILAPLPSSATKGWSWPCSVSALPGTSSTL